MVELLNLVYHCLVLALVVLGLAVVFGMLGVMNMAHGEFLMLGAFSAVTAQAAACRRCGAWRSPSSSAAWSAGEWSG